MTTPRATPAGAPSAQVSHERGRSGSTRGQHACRAGRYQRCRADPVGVLRSRHRPRRRPARSRGSVVRLGWRRLQLKRVDPWTVLKISLIVAIVMFFVWMIAVGVLYLSLGSMDVWTKINSTYETLVTPDSTTGTTGPLVTPSGVFIVTAVIGAINIVLFTALVDRGGVRLQRGGRHVRRRRDHAGRARLGFCSSRRAVHLRVGGPSVVWYWPCGGRSRRYPGVAAPECTDEHEAICAFRPLPDRGVGHRDIQGLRVLSGGDRRHHAGDQGGGR